MSSSFLRISNILSVYLRLAKPDSVQKQGALKYIYIDDTGSLCPNLQRSHRCSEKDTIKLIDLNFQPDVVDL